MSSASEPVDCHTFIARHSEYLDGRMDVEMHARWRLHADHCDECERYDHVVRRGTELVRDLPAPRVPSDFYPRLEHRIFHIREDERRRANRTIPSVSTALIAGIAVVGIALAAAGDSFITSGSSSSASEPNAAAASVPTAGATPADAQSADADPEIWKAYPDGRPVRAAGNDAYAGRSSGEIRPADGGYYRPARGTMAYPGPYSPLLVAPTTSTRGYAAPEVVATPVLMRE